MVVVGSTTMADEDDCRGRYECRRPVCIDTVGAVGSTTVNDEDDDDDDCCRCCNTGRWCCFVGTVGSTTVNEGEEEADECC